MSTTFGGRLRATMKALGVTQVELARKTGLSQNLVSMWWRGERDPDTALVDRVADALRVPAAYLVSDAFGEVAPEPLRASIRLWELLREMGPEAVLAKVEPPERVERMEKARAPRKGRRAV